MQVIWRQTTIWVRGFFAQIRGWRHLISNKHYARTRALIILAGLMVCLYAGWVHYYVLSVPDIGLHTLTKPVIARVDPEYIVETQLLEGSPMAGNRDYVPAQFVVFNDSPLTKVLWCADYFPAESLRGWTIQQVDEWKTGTWPLYLRALIHLRGHEGLVKVQLARETHGQTQVSRVWCKPGILPLRDLVPSILWIFVKLGLFLVGAFVLWKRPDDRAARQFFLLCIVTFGAYIGGYHWSRIVTQPVLLLVFVLCCIFLPAVSLHFYLIFPQPKKFLHRHSTSSLLVIYGPALVSLQVLVVAYVNVRWHGGEDELSLIQLKYCVYSCFVLAAFWYLACIVCLIHSYRTVTDIMARNQVKWILFGALASLVPIGYTLYLAFWQMGNFVTGEGTWPMFAASVCLTAAFTISITRYRLMQLDQIVSSGMVFFLLSSLAGLAYYAVVFAATFFSSQWIATGPPWLQALAVSGVALVLLLTLDLIRGRIRRVLDRRFYRDKYQLDRTLRRMSEAVEQLVDPPALARRLLQISADLFGAAQGAVYLRAGDDPLYRLSESLGPPPPLNELSSGCPLVEVLQARAGFVARSRPGRTAEPAQRQLQFLGGEVAQALTHESKMLAMLILGPRALGSYGSEDLNLLAALAQVTALALESTRVQRTIETLNRDLKTKVEKISEQQRRILALQSQLMKRDTQITPPADPAQAPVLDDSQAPILSNSAGIVGSSVQIRHLLHLVRKVAASPSAVLLRGESGTGKELLARALHDNSPRVGKAFVKVHCAALSPGLLESELFGHVKGAFTGAHRDKVGRFELADGGTVFLDEIGDISLETQTKLLRVLQEMTFERVGSSAPVQVNVRVIAATHQDLEQLISQGRFRADLYYRLNVISILVPPLRERREDIPELVMHFLREYAQRGGSTVDQIDDDVLALLKAYDWPGNIRQLENVVERAVVISERPIITVHELPPELWTPRNGKAQGPGTSEPPDEAASSQAAGGIKAERAERDRKDREQLVRALAAAQGNKTEAARALGLARSTLVSRLRKHGLQ